MKRIISITLVLSVILSMFGAINAFAVTEGRCGDNAYWKLEDGVLTIWGKGVLYDTYSKNSNPEWFASRTLIKKVIIEEGITEVYGWTFYRHNNLEIVEFPNSLHTIGYWTFDECYNISYIDWKDWMPKQVLMYAADGRVCIFDEDEVEAQKTVGWYIEPIKKMSSEDFETGLHAGIDYLDKNLYYEAQNEFQQFSDNNWYNMTKEQQETIVDYINKSKAGAETNEKIPEGINYFNQGLYYEAIRELQGVCDAYWYNMTKNQQQTAVDYINKSKAKLADLSYNAGKNYYNKGLYYEAQKEFTNAVELYTKNTSQWQSANDYLYNTNERIKEWENRNTPSKNSSPSYYPTYRNSYVPSYEAITGHKNYTLGIITDDGDGFIYSHQYMNYDKGKESMREGIDKYKNALINMGYSIKNTSVENIITLYNKVAGKERIYIFEKGIKRVKIRVLDYNISYGKTWSTVDVYAYE